MKKLILYISILLISVLYGACSESSSKEDNVVQGLMYDYKITEKQVKCLIKETKPLVKKTNGTNTLKCGMPEQMVKIKWITIIWNL